MQEAWSSVISGEELAARSRQRGGGGGGEGGGEGKSREERGVKRNQELRVGEGGKGKEGRLSCV